MQRLVNRIQKVIKQNVFRRYGGIRLKLERPMAIGVLEIEQRFSAKANGFLQRLRAVGHRRLRAGRVILWYMQHGHFLWAENAAKTMVNSRILAEITFTAKKGRF